MQLHNHISFILRRKQSEAPPQLTLVSYYSPLSCGIFDITTLLYYYIVIQCY